MWRSLAQRCNDCQPFFRKSLHARRSVRQGNSGRGSCSCHLTVRRPSSGTAFRTSHVQHLHDRSALWRIAAPVATHRRRPVCRAASASNLARHATQLQWRTSERGCVNCLPAARSASRVTASERRRPSKFRYSLPCANLECRWARRLKASTAHAMISHEWRIDSFAVSSLSFAKKIRPLLLWLRRWGSGARADKATCPSPGGRRP